MSASRIAPALVILGFIAAFAAAAPQVRSADPRTSICVAADPIEQANGCRSAYWSDSN